MDYEVDSSDEDIGLTNNKHINSTRLHQYEQIKENRFCYAMVIILLFAISVVIGLFVAMSFDDVMIQQTPITTVTNLFYSNNNTNFQSSNNTRNVIEPHIDWKAMLRKRYNVKFSDHPLVLLDRKSQLKQGHILTNIILDDSFQVPYIYQHANVWNIKYPYSKNDMYEANAHRKWCFNFYLYNYEAAQIDIKFNAFQVETGFDRIIIRHFNQSIIHPPLIIAGRGKHGQIPSPITYHIWENEFKSICIELQTDDTINLNGIDFDVIVRYDDCVWSNWYGCYISDQLHKNWTVHKPYYDGKCGIGVDSRVRTSIVLMEKDRDPNDIWPDGFVNWVESSIYGPKYCIKSNCNAVNGPIDPKYPDLIAIIPSHVSMPIRFESVEDVKQYMQSELFMNTYISYPSYKLLDKNRFNINYISEELIKTKNDIIGQYSDQQILFSVVNNDRLSQEMEYLGARLISSLLIGRTFSMTFIGYDNTAGYKYQFANSYPIQLQSILRMLWQRIGVDGAAFTVRNIGIGGLSSDSNYLQLLYSNIRASDSSQDIIIWEYTPRTSALIAEIHLRMSAFVNAIWSPIILLTNNCIKRNENVNNEYYLFQLFERYNQSVGMIAFNFTQFLDVMNDICVDEAYLNQKANRMVADILAYNILDVAIKFIDTYHKVLHTANTVNLHDWLLKKSGNWNTKGVLKSIPAIFCGIVCDQLTAPFALTAFEPNEWNVAFRLGDYVYSNMTNLEGFGWKYTDFNHLNKGNPSHYPQDRLGDIGSMDRKNIFIPNREFFRDKFDEFLMGLKNDDTAEVMKEQIQSVNKDNTKDLRILKQGYYRKYNEQFMEYIIDNDFVLKIAVLIPNIGAHSILIANNQNRSDFIGNGLNIYELLLTPITKHKSGNKESDIKFSEVLSTQRKCDIEFIKYGCLISSIPANKYILSIIPKNILLADDISDDTFSIASLIAF